MRTAPRSVVYHRFGGTSRRVAGALFRERLGLRHDLRSLIENYELATLLKVLPRFLALLAKRTWTTRSFRFLHCLAWNLRHLPSTLRQRRTVQRTRRLSDRQLSAMIDQHERVPYYEPDYTPVDRAAFLHSNCRKSWVNPTDRRWNVLGHGWYFVESCGSDSQIKYRWSQGEAVVHLWNHFGRGTLEMEVLGYAPAARKPRIFYVSVNDRPAVRCQLPTNDWQTIRVIMPGPPVRWK